MVYIYDHQIVVYLSLNGGKGVERVNLQDTNEALQETLGVQTLSALLHQTRRRSNRGVAVSKVKMTVEGKGEIEIELYPDIAPLSAENFLKLVDGGFYNGLIFHRVISGFMIQGGCPNGSGTGGPGWNIKGEFASNGVKNPIKHERGVLSMARAANPDSAGSQFFIMHEDAPHLDGQYAAFGKVISGMDVVDTIASCQTLLGDKPVTPQRITSIVRT